MELFRDGSLFSVVDKRWCCCISYDVCNLNVCIFAVCCVSMIYFNHDEVRFLLIRRVFMCTCELFKDFPVTPIISYVLTGLQVAAMSLQWTAVATFLYAEVFAVLLLCVPFISPKRYFALVSAKASVILVSSNTC